MAIARDCEDSLRIRSFFLTLDKKKITGINEIINCFLIVT